MPPGRFEFRHFLHRQLVVTACPRDFAVTSAIIDVNMNATESRIQVAPLQPLRIRVEDGQGPPGGGRGDPQWTRTAARANCWTLPLNPIGEGIAS